MTDLMWMALQAMLGVCVYLAMKWLQERIARAPKHAPLLPQKVRYAMIIGVDANGTVMEKLSDGTIRPAEFVQHLCPRCHGEPKSTFCGLCGKRRYEPPQIHPICNYGTFVTVPAGPVTREALQLRNFRNVHTWDSSQWPTSHPSPPGG